MSDTAEKLMIVDAHVHFWDMEQKAHPWLHATHLHPHRYGDYRPVCRTFLPAHYRSQAAPWQVVSTIYMEAEWSPNDPLGETKWVHDLNESSGLPQAMAGQVWLVADDAGQLIAQQAAFPLVRSLRQKPASFAHAHDWHPSHALSGSMRCPKFREGYRYLADHGLHFELQTPFWHLPDAAELAGDFPDTLIVVNHTGLPGDRHPTTLMAWERALATLADCPNVVLKVGGLGIPGAGSCIQMNKEVVLRAIRLFGADRCMFASNYPVDGLFAPLDKIIADMVAITAELPASEQHAFFRHTASMVYLQ